MATMLRLLLLLLCIFCGVVIGSTRGASNHIYEVYAPDQTDSERIIYAKTFPVDQILLKTTANKNTEVKDVNDVMQQLGYVITIAFSILFYPFVFPVLLALFTFLKSFFITNIVKIITLSFASIVIFCNATSYCNAYGWSVNPVEEEVRNIMKTFATNKSDDNFLSQLVNEAIQKHKKKNRKQAPYPWY